MSDKDTPIFDALDGEAFKLVAGRSGWTPEWALENDPNPDGWGWYDNAGIRKGRKVKREQSPGTSDPN